MKYCGHSDILVGSKFSNKFENIHFRKQVNMKFSLLLLCSELNTVVGPRILYAAYMCVCVCVCVFVWYVSL